MFRIALKGVMARKGRLLLTSLAVILGTAFLAGSFVFTDTIRRTFDNLFADVYQDTDAVVRSSHEISGDFGQSFRANIPASLLDEVSALPNVAEVQPDVTGFAIIVDQNGDKIGGDGPPTLGSNFYEGDLSPWHLTDGSAAPSGPNEVVLDNGSFKDGDFKIGDTVKITGVNSSQEFTIVGSAKFKDVDSPGGATFAMFDLDTAQQFLLPKGSDGSVPDEFSTISVKSDGSISDRELATQLQERLGSDTEVLTGAEITDETQSDIRDALSFFTIFLTVFALISLFVACFVIYNVFTITQAQRAKESALMRAIGSSRRQVSSAMLVEALFIGIVGSLLGLIGGIALATGLQGLLKALGIDIPSTGINLEPRTIVITMVVGLLVTVLSALVPARKAGRVPPVEAMRDSAVESTAFSKKRLIAGLVLMTISVLLIILGLAGGEPLALAPGIPLAFIALYVLGPLIARRFALILGRPIVALKGVTGHMARENAARNPKRTASTAAALLIGVALVTGVAVVASSAKASVRDIFAKQIAGDLVVNSGDAAGASVFPTSLADEINTLPGVQAAAGVSLNPVKMAGKDTNASGVDPATFGQVFDLDFRQGKAEDLTADGIALSESRAEKLDVGLGDTVQVTTLDGSTHDLTVTGIYHNDELAGPQVMSRELFSNAGNPVLDFSIFVLKDPSADTAQVKSELQQTVDNFGIGKVQTRQEYIDEQAASIDTFINLVYGLLALSIFIAAVGILLTMLLSVFERRRELALSRAVGMSKRQVRSMVRWEAVITSLLGALQGVIVGLALGYALVWALRSEGFKKFDVPIGTIIVVVVLAAALGVAAAIIPARRATKINVVEAIATT
jgi:putative ABC transport system permease protein